MFTRLVGLIDHTKIYFDRPVLVIAAREKKERKKSREIHTF